MQFQKYDTGVGSYWTSSLPKVRLYQKLAECNLERIKVATIGGEPSEGFEQSFASLAYTYVKDRSARLFDYIIGFQLIDRNNDNTKAAGVFGFKVGDMWLYVPVFFLSGRLKGHELLWVMNKKMFVPCKENWVNHLIGRKPQLLGSPTSRDKARQYGRKPQLERLIMPPQYSKFSSFNDHIEDWAKPFVSVFATMVTDPTRLLDKTAMDLSFDLTERLNHPSKIAATYFSLYNQFPGVKNAFDEFYGEDLLPSLATRYRNIYSGLLAPQEPKYTQPTTRLQLKQAGEVVTKKKVQVLTDEDVAITDNIKDLSDSERETLAKNKVLIRDERSPDEVSTVYNTQQRMSLSNPDVSGYYDVLTRPGKFEKLLVLTSPYTSSGQASGCILVDVNNPKRNYLSRTVDVWVDQESADFNLEKHVGKLPSTKSLEKNKQYMVVGDDGRASAPFTVRTSNGPRHTVYWDDWFKRTSSIPALRTLHSDSEHMSDYGVEDNVVIINEKPGANLRFVRGELHVPGKFKIVPLGSRGYESEEDKPELISPGNIADLQATFYSKTAELAILAKGREYYVGTKEGTKHLSKQAALIELVTTHNLREKTARELLETAEVKGRVNDAVRVRVKHAFVGNSVYAPAIPEPDYGSEQYGYRTAVTQSPQFLRQSVDSINSTNGDPRRFDPFYQPDHETAQIAQQAAQSGQKELFDISVFSGMLKTVSPDMMIDSDLGDLMKALHRLGTQLFKLFWHPELYEERFGKQDLPELEDAIRNSFERLGDVTLYLKEKSVGSLDEAGATLGQPGEPNVDDAAYS